MVWTKQCWNRLKRESRERSNWRIKVVATHGAVSHTQTYEHKLLGILVGLKYPTNDVVQDSEKYSASLHPRCTHLPKSNGRALSTGVRDTVPEHQSCSFRAFGGTCSSHLSTDQHGFGLPPSLPLFPSLSAEATRRTAVFKLKPRAYRDLALTHMANSTFAECYLMMFSKLVI